MQPEVTIRSTTTDDLPYLAMLFAEDTMPLPSEEELFEGFVAVNDKDEPVGFIHILKVTDEEYPPGNGCYVYPVIVFKSWQGHGVGRILITHAHKECGELKLVACKASREFYPKCGFEPLDWDEVATKIANECDQCADLETCKPQPYILR